MTKFKNKKTGKVIEEHLLYYVEKLRKNPEYKEIVEKQLKPEKENKEEVEEDKPLQ